MRYATRTALALAFFSSLATPTLAQDVTPLTAKELSFSVENMDTTADPRKDFYAYASGIWQMTAVRPDDKAAIGPFDYMGEQLKSRMLSALTKAAADAATAEKGSTTQLVGDFYAAYMDTTRMDAVGMAAAQPELDRIKSITTKEDLSRFVARYAILTGDLFLFGFGPSADRVDNKKLSLYAASGDDGIPYPVVFQSADGAKEREAYRTFMRDALVVAGYDKRACGEGCGSRPQH